MISQNDLVQRLVREHTDAEVIAQELHSLERYSGTEIRRRIRAGEDWRDLVPDCCEATVAEYGPEIEASGERSVGRGSWSMIEGQERRPCIVRHSVKGAT